MGKMTDKASAAIARVEALGDEAGRIFAEFEPERILRDAAALDAKAAERAPERAAERTAENATNSANVPDLPLYGTLISLKDLFDEAGHSTRAGSRLLQDRPPATADAAIVTRLKNAGALMFGRTTLSEFAYSGVGINPHYGSPGCVFDKSLVPGGSSSGGALSVAHGLCDLAMGTDTGGSVRLPAAVNGLYGYKPTHSTIPRDGVHPLSNSYDSVGPLGSNLPELLDCLEVLRDRAIPRIEPDADGAADKAGGSSSSAGQALHQTRQLTLAVPVNAYVDDADASVVESFNNIVEQIRSAGHIVQHLDLAAINQYAGCTRAIVSTEANAYYRPHLQELEKIGDPDVLARLRYADTLSDDEKAKFFSDRVKVIKEFHALMQPFDALLAPTVMCERRSFAEAEADFPTVNIAMLRNTSLINLVDGCGLSIPVARKGQWPAALMVAGAQNDDDRILAAGQLIDQLLATAEINS